MLKPKLQPEAPELPTPDHLQEIIDAISAFIQDLQSGPSCMDAQLTSTFHKIDTLTKRPIGLTKLLNQAPLKAPEPTETKVFADRPHLVKSRP